MYSKKHLAPLALIAAVVGGICVAVGLLFNWSPRAISPEADRVDGIMWALYWSSAFIFTIVVSILIYCVWKFRRQPGDDSDGPPVHGNTMLEIIWTVIPTLLLAGVAAYAVVVINRNEALAAPANRIDVNVNAQQFNWTFEYEGVRTGDLRVPAGDKKRQIRLNITASDVIHDFWVPELRVKQDATPGVVTHLVFTPRDLGTYPIVCAELCGAGHGLMRSRLIVMKDADYEAWATAARAQAAATK